MAKNDWFTVNVVEDVQHALNLNVNPNRIAAALAEMRQATLPALMEYGCVRSAFPQLPPLPPALQNSVLGQEMQLVVSPFGIRTTGANRQAPTDLNARPCEFMAFASEEDVVGDAAEFYKTRFWKSALQVGFAKSVANFLAAGLHEMMTNAVQHAATPVPMLAGYAVYPNMAQFTVVDVGQGVLSALKQSATYGDLDRHMDALRIAVQPGVTSEPSGRGGFGFNDIFQALAEQWGYMRFRSGEAALVADGTGLHPKAGEPRSVPPIAGFQVSVTCRSTVTPPDRPIV